ncbi:MAG: serine/threonine protein kinase [Gemmatimonadales bacterium]|nr:serine/threonine protein kinase [Gemmatimonadales bacterium]
MVGVDEQPELDLEIQSRLSSALGPKYSVRGLIGRGGFAEVYEVWDEELHRRLAVKVLRPGIAWTGGMLTRFKQEARSVARLTHPNILPIHFVGDGGGLVYYAMPYVEGQSLAQLIRNDGALAWETAVDFAIALLGALEHAHERGLVHRDLKPDNIMIDATTGRVLLVDFGIAKRLDGGKGETQTGFVVGTPQYMSPEQALGQGDLDGRSDLYSLGAVLFQMVTGTPPFDGDSSQEIVGKHIAQPPPVASSKDARIPLWLSDIIVRCLAKRPAARYQSAGQVAEALRKGLTAGPNQVVSTQQVAQLLGQDHPTEIIGGSGQSVAVPRSASSTQGRGKRLRNPLALAALGVLLVIATGAVVRMTSPSLVFANRLVHSVRLVVNGNEYAVAPSSEFRLRLPRKQGLTAQWYLDRMKRTDGSAVGTGLQGTLVEDEPRGSVQWAADVNDAQEVLFAPLITNMTDEPLSLTVNAGLEGAEHCGCSVPPGTTRAVIGYYSLYTNTTVEARTPAGRVARFENLGPKVDPRIGAVGLRFEKKDFSWPADLQARFR